MDPNRAVAVIGLLSCAACGGGSPTQPGPTTAATVSTTTSTTTTTSVPSWSLSGTLRGVQGQQPLAGADVSTPGVTGVQTDIDGRYRLAGSNPSFTPYLVTFARPDLVTREVYQLWERTAQSLDGTAIELRPPFSLDYYQQFVRGTIDHESQPLRRWTTPPRLYLAATNGRGQPLAPSDITMVRDTAIAAIRELTGFTISVFESAPEAREDRDGWITIELTTSEDVCGRARVGTNPGHVWLNHGGCRGNRCGTAAILPNTVAHEFGRANHVSDPAAVMYATGGDCRTVAFSGAERYHAQIAYSRPPGTSIRIATRDLRARRRRRSLSLTRGDAAGRRARRAATLYRHDRRGSPPRTM